MDDGMQPQPRYTPCLLVRQKLCNRIFILVVADYKSATLDEAFDPSQLDFWPRLTLPDDP